MKSERVEWVDSLRFLGMLAVYIGHFGPTAGKLYPFVFIFHVPLFFFAAGFFAGRAETVPAMVVRLVRRLLLPYVFFALLYAVTLALFYDWPWLKLQDALVAFATGIRNQVPAGSLWFLPCLFVVALAHGLVLRVGKWAALAFAAVCFLVSRHGLGFDPLDQPSWFLNADSALYFVLWYALGHAAFPWLTGAVRRPWFAALGLVAAAAAGFLYFNGTADAYSLLDAIPPGRRHALAHDGLSVLLVVTCILAVVALARAVESIELLRWLGGRTLVLCGAEDLSKLLASQALIVLGLQLHLIHPLGVVLWCFACLLLAGLFGAVLDRHAPMWTGLRRN